MTVARTCPTCNKEFETLRGRNVHHASVHGKSLAKTTEECPECGDPFEYYKCQKDGERQFCSQDCSNRYYSGEQSPNWKGRVVVECRYCGEDRKVAPWAANRPYCDEECEGKWRSENLVGPDSPNWKGGSTATPFGHNWEDIRREVIERDGACLVCGATKEGDTRISVHHITPRKEFTDDEVAEKANRPSNLVTLCMSCHLHVEHGNISCPSPRGDQ